jgi:nitrogen-specific signal transduction histidine kinase
MAFQSLMVKQNRTTSEFARYNRALEMVHHVGESVWQVQTRDAVFGEACRGVLTNSDYVLAWIGIQGDNNHIIPVIADGSTTMSRQEQDECMTALLTAADDNPDKYDGAQKALSRKLPVILRNILEELPKGPFKNTPFAGAKADCIALPLFYDQQIFGVMNIYSIAPLSFSEEEIELLQGMSREIVFAIFALAAKESNKSLARLQAVNKKVFKNNVDLILVIQPGGTIVEANSSAEQTLGSGSGTIIGTDIYELFQSASSASPHFLDGTSDGGKNITLELKESGTEYMASISPLKHLPDENDTYLLVARDISAQKTHKIETVRASKLAAMGELSVGVANEINNLTNGLINFTQILSEEVAETAGSSKQSSELLHNIIKLSERISQIVQQLLFFSATRPQTKEAVKINKIIEDSLALTKHQFRYDAIDVAFSFPDIVPTVKVNVQEMQHVFLNLLSNARYALNQRFPGKHPQKRIEIKGEITAREEQQLLKVLCTDFGVGIPPDMITRIFEPFFTTKPEGVGTGLGLSICRNIVEDNNGTLNIESILNDHTSITLEMPIAV